MKGIQFEHPMFWLLLEMLPLLVIALVLYWTWRRQALLRVGDPDLLKRLMPGYSARLFWVKNSLLAFSLILLSIAAANPQRGLRRKTIAQKSSDVMLVFDVSTSMLCQDVSPSRLERAKLFATKLVSALQSERIGLVLFAGEPSLQMPLSTDYGAASMYLRGASPDAVTPQGTNLGAAIDLAVRSFDANPGAGRAVILITDAENHEDDAVEHAEAANKDGTSIYVVGVGTVGGGAIPLPGGQFKRDADGEVVRTKLNEEILQDLAKAGSGGSAYNVTQMDAAISALQREISGLQKKALDRPSAYDEFESFFQWFLLPALMLLVLEQWLSWRKQ